MQIKGETNVQEGETEKPKSGHLRDADGFGECCGPRELDLTYIPFGNMRGRLRHWKSWNHCFRDGNNEISMLNSNEVFG